MATKKPQSGNLLGIRRPAARRATGVASDGLGNSRVLLPKQGKTEEIVNAVKALHDKNQDRLKRHQVEWLRNMYYLDGQRNISVLDYTTGTILFDESPREDDDEKMRLVLEKIFQVYQMEVGHLMSLDLRPAVETQGDSLDGVKKRSIAKLLFTHLMPEDKMRALHAQVAEYMVKTSCCGLGVYSRGDEVLGEVIPPWELGPVPYDVPSPDLAGGIMRMRKVPKAALKDYFSPVKLPKSGPDTEIVKFGETPAETTLAGNDLMSAAVDEWRPDRSQPKAKATEDSSEWTWLDEVWIQNYAGELQRYLAVADGEVILDQVIGPTERVPMPIWMIRYGCPYGFYGRSNIFGAITLNEEAEYMLTQLCANVENLDLYGKTLFPSTAGLNEDDMVRSASGGCYIRYNPAADPTGRGPVFHQINPSNPGTLPGQVLGSILGLLDSTTASTPMMRGEAPGRVDSASGLRLISEASAIPMAAPVNSLREGFVGFYRALLYKAKSVWPENRPVSLTLLDETLAGIEFDDATGGITLTRDMIPHPNEVSVGIISEIPVSKAALEMGLRENLQMGILDPQDFRIQARKMGLNTPVGNDAEWENYRNAVRENLVMFNDGITPGPTQFAQVEPTDMHDVHGKVHLRFMGGPEFAMCSDAVKEAFRSHHGDHQNRLGALPEGVENLDMMNAPLDPAMLNQLGMGMGVGG